MPLLRPERLQKEFLIAQHASKQRLRNEENAGKIKLNLEQLEKIWYNPDFRKQSRQYIHLQNFAIQAIGLALLENIKRDKVEGRESRQIRIHSDNFHVEIMLPLKKRPQRSRYQQFQLGSQARFEVNQSLFTTLDQHSAYGCAANLFNAKLLRENFDFSQQVQLGKVQYTPTFRSDTEFYRSLEILIRRVLMKLAYYSLKADANYEDMIATPRFCFHKDNLQLTWITKDANRIPYYLKRRRYKNRYKFKQRA